MGGDGPVFGRADIVWSRAGCHAAATRVRERGATRRCLQAVGHGRHWCGMWCGRRGYPRALGVAPTAVLPARPRCAKDSRARKSDSPTMAARPDGNGLRQAERVAWGGRGGASLYKRAATPVLCGRCVLAGSSKQRAPLRPQSLSAVSLRLRQLFDSWSETVLSPVCPRRRGLCLGSASRLRRPQRLQPPRSRLTT